MENEKKYLKCPVCECLWRKDGQPIEFDEMETITFDDVEFEFDGCLEPKGNENENCVRCVISNCLDCEFHDVIPDPDPNDWFCDDDQAAVCTLTENNPRYDANSPYLSTSQNTHRCITVSCRPYNLRKECSIPNWCPRII